MVFKISCKKILYITVKLDFGIDKKSMNFDFKNSQNISVDQILTERFHFIKNLL